MKGSLPTCKCILAAMLFGLSMTVTYGQQPMASANVLAKNTQPHQAGARKSLKHVLKELEGKYHVSFGYLDNDVDNKFIEKVNLEGSIEDVLGTLLPPLDLKFIKMQNNFYLIQKNKKEREETIQRDKKDSEQTSVEAETAVFAPQQQETSFAMMNQVIDFAVSGTVKDASDGSALPGVNVLVKGTTIGTTTDSNGKYTLNAPDGNATLIFSFIGYKTEEIAVNSRSVIDLELAADAQELSEVVVVGYGTVKRTDLTGAVAVVDNEALVKRNTVNPMEAIQGQVAGVDISNSSGRVGGGFNIQIRGVQSLTGESSPLYVVDGVITGGIDFLNPQDIERIDILKDASSTAIYGSRGAYGVVLVTTKQGSSSRNKASISYDGYYGVRSVSRLPDFMDGDTWMDWRIDAYTSDALVKGNTPNPNAAFNVDSGELQRRLDENDFTDWPSLVLQDGRQQNHWVSLSGMGDNKLGYNIGFGYQEEEGNVIHEDYKRYNFKASVTHTLNSKWKGGANMNISVVDFNAGAPNAMRNAFRMNPVLSPYDTDTGEIIIQPGKDRIDADPSKYHINFTSSTNPLVDLAVSHQQTQTYYAIGNIFLEYSPLDWLSFKTTFAPRFKTERYGLYEGTNSEGRYNTRPGAEVRNLQSFSYVWDNQVMINKKINEVHQFNFMGLFSTNLFRDESTRIRDEFIDMSAKDFYNIGLNSEKDNIVLDGNYTRETIMSFATRLNYSFKDKYLVTLSNRWDGASVLSVGNKWDFFPSAAVGWKISSEPFMQNVSFVNDLKARLSYGATGNKVVDPYSTQAFASTLTYYDFGGTVANGIRPDRVANSLLTWEKTTELDFGVDFGLFSSRLTGSIDYYNKVSKDLILDRLLPFESGYEDVTQNIAEVTNKGIEVSLTSVNISNNDLTWTTTFNFAKNNNEVTALYEDTKRITSPKDDGYDADDVIQVGQPLGSYWNYQVDGVWQAGDDQASVYGQTEGQGRVVDVDNNGVINDNDKRFLGSLLPDWTGGFTTTLEYKGFDLSASLITRQGVFVYSRFHAEFTNPRDRGRQKLNVNWYMPENPVGPARASNFQPQVYNPGIYWQNNNVGYYRDASFTKVKNITLGYSFPASVLSKLGVSKFRVYLSALNPIVISDYDGMDPEWATSAFENGGVSTTTYLGGVNLTF